MHPEPETLKPKHQAFLVLPWCQNPGSGVMQCKDEVEAEGRVSPGYRANRHSYYCRSDWMSCGLVRESI